MPDRSKGCWIRLNGTRPADVAFTGSKQDGTRRGWIRAKLKWHIPNKKGMGRAKGNSLERETAKILSRWIYKTPDILKRTPLSGGWSSEKMGDVIADPEKERLGYKNVPVYVECRSYKDILQHDVLTWAHCGKPATFTKWIKEVEKKCQGRLPMLVMKGNHTKPWVLLMDSWLGERIGGLVMTYAPIVFDRGSRVGYLIPLSDLEKLGDGQRFFEMWRENGDRSTVK